MKQAQVNRLGHHFISSFRGMQTITAVSFKKQVPRSVGVFQGAGKVDHGIELTAIVERFDTIDSIQWERLTFDNHRHNIRPMVVSGDGYKAVLWSRGRYNSYTDYYLDTVGLVQ